MDDTSSPLPDSEHFWVELDQILQAECTSVQEVDEVLKNYLRFIASSQETHLTSEYDWYRCCYGLLESQIYKKHKSYVRRRIIGRLRKETAPSRIYLAATILLYDGRRNQKTFEVMQNEGMFPRLTQLILEKSEDGGGGLQHRLMELLYEMSRIQKLGYEDLRAVNDMFVSRLFEIIEESADENDPYHYVTIRVLVCVLYFLVYAHYETNYEIIAGPQRTIYGFSTCASTTSPTGG